MGEPDPNPPGTEGQLTQEGDAITMAADGALPQVVEDVPPLRAGSTTRQGWLQNGDAEGKSVATSGEAA